MPCHWGCDNRSRGQCRGGSGSRVRTAGQHGSTWLVVGRYNNKLCGTIYHKTHHRGSALQPAARSLPEPSCHMACLWQAPCLAKCAQTKTRMNKNETHARGLVCTTRSTPTPIAACLATTGPRTPATWPTSSPRPHLGRWEGAARQHSTSHKHPRLFIWHNTTRYSTTTAWQNTTQHSTDNLEQCNISQHSMAEHNMA